MAAGAVLDASAVEQLAEEADRAKRYLDKLELPEAEEVFRGILQRLPIYHSVQTDRIIVASLAGLAEIHAKHCRSVRDQELDWLCGMLFSLLFYRASSEVCSKVIRHRKQERRNGNGNGSNGYGDHFSDVLSRCKNQANTVEVCLLSALRDQVFQRCAPTFPRLLAAPVPQRKTGFDDAWLDGLWEFCVRSAADYQIDYNTPTEPQLNDRGRRRYSLISRDGSCRLPSRTSNPMEEAAAARPSSPGEDSVRSSETAVSVGVRRRINFDRFQDAIKHFVSDVSTDIRNKYMHISGKIPHGLLEKRVCSELALRMSQGSEDGEELQGIFEALLDNDDDGMSMGTIDEEDLDEAEKQSEHLSSDDDYIDEEEEEMEDDATIELYIKPSALYAGGGKSESSSQLVASPSRDVVLYANGPTAPNSLAVLPAAKGREKSPSRRLEANTNGNGQRASLTVANINTPPESGKVTPHRGGGRNGVLTKWIGGKPSPPGCNTLPPWSTVGGFEELSQFTEKKERIPWTSTDSEIGLHRYINESKLSQLLATTASKLGDSLRKELRFLEACQLYKYAYGILKGYPLIGGQQETMARLLVDIGSTCCSVGDLESGTQLMREAASLYESCGETVRAADVWYQMGNAFLADNLRLESLLARMMQLTKEDLQEDAELDLDDGSSMCSNDSSSSPDEDVDDDTYCPCILEAITCYQRALEVMATLLDGGRDADLLANTLSNLADCRLMTGNLDLAERGYEEALHLFTSTYGNALLQKNAHVLCMLGTLNFLSRNYVRAATMYETSHILRQHLPDDDEPTLEMTWCLTMLGLSYHFLGHYHQSITWCVRSFKLYTRFFRGRLLTVDALNRWFIVQNLYVLGFACVTLRLHKKALHYLNFCRNMLPETDVEQDPEQSVRVLLALGDAYDGLADETNKTKYHAEAQERAKRLDSGTKSGSVLSQEVLYRLGADGASEQAEKSGTVRDTAVVQQQSLETSIKDDMVSILLKLGLTTTAQTDIDWAIGCYDDCVQGYRALQESREAARALSSLGTLCQVKGRMQQGDKEGVEFRTRAENYFREAYGMVDSSSPVSVQFGNFLYGEGRYGEALDVLLPFVFCRRPEDVELSYSGIEQMALPVHLHRNIQEEETLVVEARVLAKFIGLLCFRGLGLKRDADDALVELYRTVVGERSTKPLNYTLLGYALLEARLFQEAAEVFTWSSWLQPESDLAYANAWTCALLATYSVMARGLDCVLQFLLQQGERNDRLSFQEKKSYLRRQVSQKARKIIRDRSIEEKMEEVSNLRKALLSGAPPHLSSTTPLQETMENHDHRVETSFKEASTNRDGLLGRHQNCVQSSATDAEENSRRVALELRRWKREQISRLSGGVPPSSIGLEEVLSGRQVEAERPGSGSRRKWRSRLYHNLPESPDKEVLLTDARGPRVEQ